MKPFDQTIFRGLVDKSQTFERLKRDIDAGRLSHAYLVVCADAELAIAFCREAARYVYCRQLCATCADCKRLENGNHTDFELVRQDKIDVETVKNMIYASNLKAEKAKFFVVSDAADINVSAQNKLLKTLEEAPQGTHFFLTTARPDMLLATIRSRAIKIFIPPLSESDILSAIGEDWEICARFSGGSLSRALEIKHNPKLLEAVKLIDVLPEKLRTSRDVLAISPLLSKTNDIQRQILDALEIKLSSLMRTQEFGYQPSAAAEAVWAVTSAKQKLAANCGFAAIVDRLLLKILEEKKNANSSRC